MNKAANGTDRRNSRVLCFDFGLRKIGVATGNSDTGTAAPLAILKAKDGKPDWHEVLSLMKDWQPQQLVVGWPINMDGSDSELSKRARKFASRLRQHCRLPVTLFDERLSSFAARQLAEELIDHQGAVDAIAAAVILQSWLNHVET